MKKPPKCLQVFTSIPRNANYPLQEFRVRTVKYDNSNVLLDIREFITSTEFTGYSPKGISLTLEQVEHLYLLMDDIMKSMKENTHGKVQPQDETVKTESESDTGNAISKEVMGASIPIEVRVQEV